jgi:hypothetical protein
VNERNDRSPQVRLEGGAITDELRAILLADRIDLSYLQIDRVARADAAEVRRMILAILTARLEQDAPSIDDHARLYEILHRSRAGRAVLWQANMATTLSKLG